MTNSLSNFVNNLAELIHKIKCKYQHDKKCKTCGVGYKDWEFCLEYTNVKMILYSTNVDFAIRFIEKI